MLVPLLGRSIRDIVEVIWDFGAFEIIIIVSDYGDYEYCVISTIIEKGAENWLSVLHSPN